MSYTSRIILSAAAFCGMAGVAEAGFSVCNESGVSRTVAIGYKDKDWTSEGWWILDNGECANLLTGDLTQRYYYLRAEIDSGDYPETENYTFCVQQDAFTIVGDTDCEARGYETVTFREIDTGPTAIDHTEIITASVNSVPDVTPVPDSGSTTEAPAVIGSDTMPSDAMPEDGADTGFGSESDFGLGDGTAEEPDTDMVEMGGEDDPLEDLFSDFPELDSGLGRRGSSRL